LNIEPQNFEGWFRYAQSFFKKNRKSTFTVRRMPCAECLFSTYIKLNFQSFFF